MFYSNKYLFIFGAVLFYITMHNNQAIAQNNTNKQVVSNLNVQQNNNQTINSNDSINTKLQEILTLVLKGLRQENLSVERIYNALSTSVYKYVKQCVENKQINSASDLDNIWKQLINFPQYKEYINDFKQKLAEYSTPNDNGQKYSINSISEITAYYVQVKYPTDRINDFIKIFSANDWIDFENRYFNFITKLSNISQNILQQDIETVTRNIMKQFNNEKIHFAEYFKELQSKQNFNKQYSRYGLEHNEQPLYMSKLQKNISNAKTISDITNYSYDNVEVEYFDDELDYVLYYIKTENDWAINYITKYINNCINNINNNEEREYNSIKLGVVLNEINNSKYKDKYNNIINNYRNSIEIYKRKKEENRQHIVEHSGKFLEIIYNMWNDEINAEKNTSLHYIGNLIQGLNEIIDDFVEIKSIYYQKELLNDLITKIWEFFTTNNVIDTIIKKLDKYINGYKKNNGYKKHNYGDDYYKHIDNILDLYKILTSESFKTNEPFIQFKKLVNWHKNASEKMYQTK